MVTLPFYLKSSLAFKINWHTNFTSLPMMIATRQHRVSNCSDLFSLSSIIIFVIKPDKPLTLNEILTFNSWASFSTEREWVCVCSFLEFTGLAQQEVCSVPWSWKGAPQNTQPQTRMWDYSPTKHKSVQTEPVRYEANTPSSSTSLEDVTLGGWATSGFCLFCKFCILQTTER